MKGKGLTRRERPGATSLGWLFDRTRGDMIYCWLRLGEVRWVARMSKNEWVVTIKCIVLGLHFWLSGLLHLILYKKDYIKRLGMELLLPLLNILAPCGEWRQSKDILYEIQIRWSKAGIEPNPMSGNFLDVKNLALLVVELVSKGSESHFYKETIKLIFQVSK